jgi:hypothetical protein
MIARVINPVVDCSLYRSRSDEVSKLVIDISGKNPGSVVLGLLEAHGFSVECAEVAWRSHEQTIAQTACAG